jgi:hypothetical protein
MVRYMMRPQVSLSRLHFTRGSQGVVYEVDPWCVLAAEAEIASVEALTSSARRLLFSLVGSAAE